MNTSKGIQNYAIISSSYCAFTLTDGALRMLVVLYFHQLGYTPLALASLFLFYEFFGIVTNLVGGWLASRFGLNKTMHFGMLLQIIALMMLTVPAEYLTIVYVMAAQAISGIAKDLNKMSAKAGIKLVLPEQHTQSNTLFHWVAILTGSKNTLKGIGFFVGGLLLHLYGFTNALVILASGLVLILITTLVYLPKDLGKNKSKPKVTQLLSHSAVINWLSAARFFLFGARDIWFVIALPVYLTTIGWDFEQIGRFFALWIIGYGIVQATTPILFKRLAQNNVPSGKTAQKLATPLMFIPAGIAFALTLNLDPNKVIIIGLALFAIFFAFNSALHSYLIVEWSDKEKIASAIGFYYMANAGGRLTGTVLSGLIYQHYGLISCLIISSAFIAASALISFKLPANTTP
jgi:predicted MFS family arabinose efflux permease